MRPIDFFDRGARLHPDRDFVVTAQESLTYRAASALSHKVGNRLRHLGLRNGQTFAVLSGNHATVLPTILGGLRIGAVHVILAAGNAIEESAAILAANHCRVLFYEGSFGEHLPLLQRRVATLSHCIPIGASCGSEEMLALTADDVGDCPDLPWTPDETAVHGASGGTSGIPKSTMLTNANFSALVATFLANLVVDDHLVNLIATPITHAGGTLALGFSSVGATHVVLPKAEPLAIMQAIQHYRVTTLFLPPTVIYMMLAHPAARTFDYTSLRNFIYAAAPMSPDKLLMALETFGPVMIQTYGQAEAPSVLTILSQRDHVEALADEHKRERLASCGRPTLLTQIAIMSEIGDLLPDGEAGEIVCRGDLVMKGYYDNPDATESIRQHGWQRTGDVGRLGPGGYLYILDRKKDMIISGGYNVYPAEVERHLLAHPSVRDCAVIGVPDDKWGEAVKAVVELSPGRVGDESELLKFCRDALGGVKTPKSIEFWPELPRNAIGKVLKRDIRDRFWLGRERRI